MTVLVIPEKTPSLNRLLGMHWAKKYQVRKKWHGLVRAARLEAKVMPGKPAEDYVRVTVMRFGPRILDVDNFIAGCKFLLDGLVKEGFAVDDSPEHLEGRYFQHVGKPYRTVVLVIPVEKPCAPSCT